MDDGYRGNARTAGREAVSVDVDGVSSARLLLDDHLVARIKPAVRQLEVTAEVLESDDRRRLGWDCWWWWWRLS